MIAFLLHIRRNKKWQLDGEGGARADARRGDGKLAAVLLDDALGDEEPQAAALARLQLVRVELHALRANQRQLLGGQTHSGVRHGDADGPRS